MRALFAILDALSYMAATVSALVILAYIAHGCHP